HARAASEDLLDLGRVDVLAAGHDEVGPARVDVEMALFIQLADVAGVEESVGGARGIDRARARRGVAVEERGAAHEDAAGGEGRKRRASLAGDAQIEACEGRSDACETEGRIARSLAGDLRACLGQAVRGERADAAPGARFE